MRLRRWAPGGGVLTALRAQAGGSPPADREPAGHRGRRSGGAAASGDRRRTTIRARPSTRDAPGRDSLLALFSRFGGWLSFQFRPLGGWLTTAKDAPFVQRAAQHLRRGIVGRRQLLEVVGAERHHRRVEVLSLLLQPSHVAGKDGALPLGQPL